MPSAPAFADAAGAGVDVTVPSNDTLLPPSTRRFAGADPIVAVRADGRYAVSVNARPDDLKCPRVTAVSFEEL